MPYTEKQRKMFNARAKSDPKMAKLADEANAMAKAGKEKPAKKAPGFKPERPSAAKKAAAVKRTPKKAY